MKKELVLSALVLFLSFSVVIAKDLGPLDGWDRSGLPNYTHQHWDFETSAKPALPQIGTLWNPNEGEPVLDFGPAEGWEWSDQWECGEGLDQTLAVDGWHYNGGEGTFGTITITIPNTKDANPIKEIFLQITSSKAPSTPGVPNGLPADPVTVSGSGPNPGGYTSGTFSTGRPHIQYTGPAPFGGIWYTYNYGLTVSPNPESETISISVPHCTVIDQIVVDTRCVPEPLSAALLGLGGLGLMRRKK